MTSYAVHQRITTERKQIEKKDNVLPQKAPTSWSKEGKDAKMKNGELLLWGLHRGGPRVRERSRLQGSFGDKVFRCPPVTGGCVLRGAATLPHPGTAHLQSTGEAPALRRQLHRECFL